MHEWRSIKVAPLLLKKTLMEQLNLFGEEFPQYTSEDSHKKYTMKVESPIYEPKNHCPNILELYDNEKVKRMIREINNSSLDEMEKKFLIEAAHRHTIFNYSKIADYYPHASNKMQELMEKSALVIIDFDKSIEYGFTKLQKEIQEEWV